MLLDRAPGRLVGGVVVDDDDLEVVVIEPRQRIQRADHHLRRLVVAGHVHRDPGPAPAGLAHRGEGPAPCRPDGLGELVCLGEQHREHADRREHQQCAQHVLQQPQVLARVVVGDEHQERGHHEGHHRQEGPPALLEPGAVDQQQAEGQHREHDRDRGERAPLGDRDDRALERELLLASLVVDAPVGADVALVTGLPRLVERLDHEVLVAGTVELVQQRAQVGGLLGRRRLGLALGAAVRRPAHLGQQHALLRELRAHLLGAVDGALDRVFRGFLLPVHQHVRRDHLHVIGEFRVLHPDVPGLGRGDAHLHRVAHAVDVFRQLRERDVAAVQRLVADDHQVDVALAVGDVDRAVDLVFVGHEVVAEPHAQRHVHPELLRDPRDLAQAVAHRVGAQAGRLLAQQLDVGRDLLLARIGPARGILALAKRRERVAPDVLGPRGHGDRAVEVGPAAGACRGDAHEDREVQDQVASSVHLRANHSGRSAARRGGYGTVTTGFYRWRQPPTIRAGTVVEHSRATACTLRLRKRRPRRSRAPPSGNPRAPRRR